MQRAHGCWQHHHAQATAVLKCWGLRRGLGGPRPHSASLERPLQVASIENEFRVFPMELLAGKGSMETEVRQHGARFRLDFGKARGVAAEWGGSGGWRWGWGLGKDYEGRAWGMALPPCTLMWRARWPGVTTPRSYSPALRCSPWLAPMRRPPSVHAPQSAGISLHLFFLHCRCTGTHGWSGSTSGWCSCSIPETWCWMRWPALGPSPSPPRRRAAW